MLVTIFDGNLVSDGGHLYPHQCSDNSRPRWLHLLHPPNEDLSLAPVNLSSVVVPDLHQLSIGNIQLQSEPKPVHYIM